MMQQQPLTAEQIEAAVARARQARAEAVRAGALSLMRALKQLVTECRQAPRAAHPAKA